MHLHSGQMQKCMSLPVLCHLKLSKRIRDDEDLSVLPNGVFPTVAHICKYSKQFFKHNKPISENNSILSKHITFFSKHNTIFVKHTTVFLKHDNSCTIYYTTYKLISIPEVVSCHFEVKIIFFVSKTQKLVLSFSFYSL